MNATKMQTCVCVCDVCSVCVHLMCMVCGVCVCMVYVRCVVYVCVSYMCVCLCV